SAVAALYNRIFFPLRFTSPAGFLPMILASEVQVPLLGDDRPNVGIQVGRIVIQLQFQGHHARQARPAPETLKSLALAGFSVVELARNRIPVQGHVLSA